MNLRFATTLRAFATLSVFVTVGLTSLAPASAADATKSNSKSEKSDEDLKRFDKEAYGKTDEKVHRDGLWNARVSPLGLAIGYFNVELEYKISDEWTVGPTVSYWKFDFNSSLYTNNVLSVESLAYGARANWSQNGAYKTGLFLSPMLRYSTAKVSGYSAYDGAKLEATGSAPVLTGLVGYHWFGETLNMSLGAGAAVAMGSTKVDVKENGTTRESSVETSRSAGLALEFMVGYVF